MQYICFKPAIATKKTEKIKNFARIGPIDANITPSARIIGLKSPYIAPRCLFGKNAKFHRPGKIFSITGNFIKVLLAKTTDIDKK